MFKCYIFFVSFWLQLVSISNEPLFLTPYIKKSQINEARKKAEVKPFLPSVRSYSGFLTVNEKYNSNLFFWFFPQEHNWLKAPLVLWLQGGPGSSSLYALFLENGPYIFKKNKLHKRKYSWTKYFNVLYIDNPVGVGFSFTDSPSGYSTNQNMVGEGMFEALRQFLLLFPQLQRNKLILSGESYAGKYVPSLAYTILIKNSTKPKINVYGLFIGNPLINPEDMLTYYSSYLETHGLLDQHGRETLLEREKLILKHIYAHRWEEAGELFQNTFFEGVAKNTTLFEELVRIPNHYHMLQDELTAKNYAEFLNKNSTKAALHVRGDKFGTNDITVYQKLKPDIMKSMKPEIGIVLDNFRTLIHFGQFDIICPYYLHLRVISNLDWSGNWDYSQSHRQLLRWKQSLCGYYKTAKQYTEVLIRNAGHFTPTNQPKWVLGLLRKFANGDFDQSSHPVDLSF